MTYTFYADFDGTLQLQVGDRLEIKILSDVDFDHEYGEYVCAIIRQTGVTEPPALGVSVTETLDLSDRLG
jgi:hypothetical protein